MFELADLAEFLEIPAEELNATKVRILSSKAEVLIRQYATLPDDVGDWPQDVRDLGLTVVARAITQSDVEGVTQESTTAGPFSTLRSYSTDAGTVWLTKAEKQMLRKSGGTEAYGVSMLPEGREDYRLWRNSWEW
jgi:phage protein gp19/gp15/gp42